MTVSRLSAVIDGNAKRGTLAVGIYLVPGFPDWKTSMAALDACVCQGVDFIEFPAISAPQWSPRTGQSVARALRDAEPYSEARATAWLLCAPIRVAIVYGSAWPSPAVWSAPAPQRAGVSGYLFESDPPDLAPYAQAAATAGAVIIPAVSAIAPDLSDGDRQVIRTGGGFVYTSMGTKTGSRSASAADLRRKQAQVRSVRPDLPLCAAFGINEPADVEELRDSGGCEGVVIGSAALDRLGDGMTAFTGWLKEIVAAAK